MITDTVYSRYSEFDVICFYKILPEFIQKKMCRTRVCNITKHVLSLKIIKTRKYT